MLYRQRNPTALRPNVGVEFVISHLFRNHFETVLKKKCRRSHTFKLNIHTFMRRVYT